MHIRGMFERSYVTVCKYCELYLVTLYINLLISINRKTSASVNTIEKLSKKYKHVLATLATQKQMLNYKVNNEKKFQNIRIWSC